VVISADVNEAVMADADQLAVAERLGAVGVWARRKFSVPMSSSAASTLATLEHTGPIRITDLAERERLTQPGMTTLVNRLELDHYAERVPDPTDGRATLVRLTPAGRAFIAQQRQGRTQALLAEVARLSATDQAALLAAVAAFDHLTGAAAPSTNPMPTNVSSDEIPTPRTNGVTSR
jgi:DNA-binding MarR family transcriptional regulator